jgi:hypothetical protein
MAENTPNKQPNKQPQVQSIELAVYQPVSPATKLDKKGWINYGDDNMYPKYLQELKNSAPVHGVLIRSIVAMISGKGFASDDPSVQAVIDSSNLNDQIDSIADDIKTFGGVYLEVINRLDRTGVAKINNLGFASCRLAADEEGEVVGVYYSKNWKDLKKNPVKLIHPYDGVGMEGGKGVVYLHVPKQDDEYYPSPDYTSCINYVELEREIGIYHVNNIMNSLMPSFIVNLYNGSDVDPDQQTEIKKQWERNLTGAKNAGKFLMSFNETDRKGVEITTFPISDADKQYQFLSSQALSLVMIGHRVTTPLLFGVRDVGGGFGSNKEEMTEGLRIFLNHVIEPYQRILIKGIEDILNAKGKITIVPNTPISLEEEVKEQIAIDGGGADVASQALNGAQITSLVDIIMQAAGNAIPIESAKAIVAAGFPMLTPAQIDNIFKDIVPGTLPQAAVLRKQIELSVAEKKKCSHNISDEDGKAWLAYLADKAEEVDEDEWDLVSIEEAGTREDELAQMEKYANLELSVGQYANGDDKSKWGDAGLFKLRFAYSQNISEDTREFCREMVNLSNQGKVFRYEDIEQMSSDGVNGQFAPEGQSTYDLFEFKGGAFCHHKWVRLIYFRKREKGRFLPNDGLKNDKRVGNVPYVPKKGKESVAPINTPTRGSLKYS